MVRHKGFLWASVFSLVVQATFLVLFSPPRDAEAQQGAASISAGDATATIPANKALAGPLSLRWEYFTSDQTNNPSSPTSDGTYVYICHGAEVIAVELATGVKHASYTAGDTQFCASPALAGKMLLVGADDGYMYAFLRPSLELKWKFMADAAIQSTPCVVGDKAIVGSDDGTLYAIEASDETWSKPPKVAWQYETQGRVKSSPAYAAGTVFFSSFDGYFYAVRADDGSLLWRSPSRTGIPTQLPSGQLPMGPGGYGGGLGAYGYGTSAATGYRSTGSYGYPSGTGTQRYSGSSSGGGPAGGGGFMAAGAGSRSDESNTLESTVRAQLRTSSRQSRTIARAAAAGGVSTRGPGGSGGGGGGFAPMAPQQPSPTPGTGVAAIPQPYLRSAQPARPQAEQPQQVAWVNLESIRPNYQMYASPVVGNGKVYLIAGTQVYALETSTGILRWLFTAQGTVLGTPAVSGKSLSFATEDGNAYCLNADTGGLIWQRTAQKGEGFASPASILGDVAVFRSRWGTIYGFKLDTGDLAWQYKLREVPEWRSQVSQTQETSGTSAGPQPPGAATGSSRTGVRQVTPNYPGMPGQIMGTGGSPYAPLGAAGTGLRTFPGQVGYSSPTTAGVTAAGTAASAQSITEVQSLADKVTSGPVAAAGAVISWGNDGTVYCFAPDVADASPPEILGSHIQFPGEDYDYAYALPLIKPDDWMKPTVTLPGSPPIYLSFWVYDEGTGINPASISITRNGQPVRHEYRPDEGSVWFIHRFSGPTAGSMEDGNYEFVITVGDWAGNVTQRKVVFAVDNTIARPGSREVVEGSQSTTAAATTSPRRGGNRPAND